MPASCGWKYPPIGVRYAPRSSERDKPSTYMEVLHTYWMELTSN
ncbi:hypothetical protein [Algoriphagus faecimaris]|nr:hypothetical protein [Algoriphagus faecimaris]